MITERANLLFSCLGASLLLAWLTQFELIYFIAAMLASILAISFLIFKINLINVTCSRSMPDAAYEDEIIKIKVVLKNRSIFPNYFIYLIDNFRADQEGKREKRILLPFLRMGVVINWEYEGLCFKRGEYWIGPFTLIGSDPLGLFKKYKIINISSKFTVYPKIFNISNLPPFIKGMITERYGSQTIRKSGDYEEFYGIREYRQEDGLRKIHWPLSVKHNQLMVRHFEQSGSHQVTIVLDLKKESNLGKDKETTLEYAIKIAASLSRYFLNIGAVVQILGWSDRPVITLRDREPSHLFIILETLARLEANGYYPLDKAMMELNPFIPPNSTLIVITLDRDMQILQSIESFIYTQNASLIDVILMASSFDKTIPSSPLYCPQVKSHNLKIYHIKCKDNLEAIFGE